MALLKPIMGGGFYWNWLLKGTRTYTPIASVSIPFGIEIKFYSPSNELVGTIGTGYDEAPHLNLNIIDKKIGGFEQGKLSISRNIDINFYNLLEARIYVQGRFWYSAELTYKPDLDRRDPVFEYQLKGYRQYLEKPKANEVYTSTNLYDVFEDLFLTYIDGKYPVIWDPGQVDLPSVSITKIEFNKKTIWKCFLRLLEIANTNFTTTQYELGVDKYRHIYFRPISNEIITGYFEGYQYQEPNVETNINDMVNKIDIFRNQEDSSVPEYVSTVEDTTSQGLYDIREENLLIADYVDINEAEKIANAKIERLKDPEISYEIENLPIELDPFEKGKYNVSSKRDDYNILINDCENVTEWVQSVTNTTISQSTEKVFTGKRSIKAETTSGSLGEYIEYELDQAIWFPQFIIFYVYQNINGESFDLVLYDEDGNSIEVSSDIRVTTDDDTRVTTDGDTRIPTFSNSGIDILIPQMFNEVKSNIAGLISNIKKIRILFTTNSNFTTYFDRFKVQSNMYLTRQLFIDEVEYDFDNTKAVGKIEFGTKFPNLVDEVKKIKDDKNTLFSIFEKRS